MLLNANTQEDVLNAATQEDVPGDSDLRRVRHMCGVTYRSILFKLRTSTLPDKTWLRETLFYVPWSVKVHEHGLTSTAKPFIPKTR